MPEPAAGAPTTEPASQEPRTPRTNDELVVIAVYHQKESMRLWAASELAARAEAGT